jgi:acetylornithine deacetylase
MYDKIFLQYWAIATLQKLISIPSISCNEDAAVLFYEQALSQIGIKTVRDGLNLIAVSHDFSPEKPIVLLNSHIDTVKPVSGWTYDPFTPTLVGERLYGLGSNDAGASLVSLAAAFARLISCPQPNNFIYLVTCQEEISGAGGMEYMCKRLPPVHFGLIGEPTMMQPATAEKGLMVIDCEVKGRSGHAARDEGENALIKALPMIQYINGFEFPKTSALVGPVKCTVTQIEAGTQHNVIPDSCRFVLDVRTNERYTNEEIFETLRMTFPECDMKARSFLLNSSRIGYNHPFVRRAVRLGLEPYSSATVSDQSYLDCPTLKMGVGDSARSHTADEYIGLHEICEGIELYIMLLDQLVLKKDERLQVKPEMTMQESEYALFS